MGQGPAPLSGVPLAEKELVRRAGAPSRARRACSAERSADASDDVARATDATGAVVLGATTAPEFGLTGFTEPAGRPPARNPWDPTTGAGGSSGGAAAAVAAGLVPFAIGSDGGGSIRIPAAWCGVVGVKPSRGRVPAQGGQGSLAGLVTAGPIARTVADAAMLLDALVAAARPRPLRGIRDRTRGRRGAVPRERGPWRGPLHRSACSRAPSGTTPSTCAVDPENAAAVARTVAMLQALGHGTEAVRLPGEDYPEFFRVLWQAGAAAIPARTARRSSRCSSRTRARSWSAAARCRRSGCVTALLAAAAFERRTIATFGSFDAVLTPTTALPPRPLGWHTAAGAGADAVFDRQVQAAPFTSFVNVVRPARDHPAGGRRDDEGRPAGVQLIGRPGGERALFDLARQLERRFGWSRRHPPAFW